MSRIDPTRLQDLIKLMLENEDQELYGFELLLEEEDFSAYFDELSEAKLFDRSRVQLEKRLDGTGAYYANKPWAPVEFLLRCAKLGNRDTAQKVLKVVVSVGDGIPPLQNYLVQGPFTEMIGAVPVGEIRDEHVALVKLWLSSGVYTWHTVDALVTGLLPRLVASRESDHAKWACDLIDTLTVFRTEAETDERAGRTGFRHDEHLIGGFLEKNAAQLAAHFGDMLLPVVLRRCREYFGADGSQEGSFWKRPAIEDHEQNQDYEEVPKALVNSARAAMLAWIDSNAEAALGQVLLWLKDDAEIVRRLAIHVLNERFALLRDSVVIDLPFIKDTLFAYGHLHESYRFLQCRFAEFRSGEKMATIEAIRTMSLSKGGDIPGFLETEQLRWLSSIPIGESDETDALRIKLNAMSDVALPDHPDFYYYISSGWSGSKSPLTIPEVTAFCVSGKLVQYANAFRQDSDDWGGPSVRGLCDAIETAIVDSPDLFADKIESLRELAPPYQYAVFRGFANLLEKNRSALNWEVVWPELLESMEVLINRNDFWSAARENARMADPDAEWVPPVVAELLRKLASCDDVLAFDTHMARSLSLIETLLSRCERLDDLGTDVVTRVINTAFGKALEALFSFALRIRRKEQNYSIDVANGLRERIKQKFDFELVRTGLQSVEFSTLSGNYVNHLRYIDEQWLVQNFEKLFPVADLVRLQCAIAGLAFAQASKFTYQNLEKIGAIDAALRLDLAGRNARQQLLRQVGLAYLWGIESLDSRRFQTLLLPANVRDLKEVIQLIGRAPPAVESDLIQRVTAFWEFCVNATDRSESEDYRKEILAASAGLAKHIPDRPLSDRHKKLVRQVAPYAWYPHEEIFFVPELLRLLPSNEDCIGLCMLEFLQGMRKSLGDNRPFHDFEGRYMQFVRHLDLTDAPLATDVVDNLRHLKEFRDFRSENP